MEENIPKVLIGLPSNGLIRVETAASLVTLLSCSKVQHQILTPISCYIHLNREKCADYALQIASDYLLFIDSDMLFPEDALTKLLALNVDIASVTYNFREYPIRSVVTLDEQYDADYAVDDSVTERPIPLNKIKNPFRCSSAGTGFMLIKTDIFRKIPKPWFFFTPETATQLPRGEDVWFSHKAREAGFEIWIDPSIIMGHIGALVF